MVTVLVISSPQALGLAVPLVAAISSSVAMRNGLVIRDRRGLDEARRLTCIVFDKSGTLTLAEHRVVDVATVWGMGPVEALRLAAAVQQHSEHSIADAIRNSATEQGLEIPVADELQAVDGQGARAVVEGRELAVGGPNLLDELKVELEDSLAAAALNASARGQSTVYLVDGSRAIAAFAVADPIRPESLEAVQRLRRQGVEVALMTSDSAPIARAAARQLGIRRVLAQVLPDEKTRRIEELKSLGKKVAMVGDGVIEADALARADIGVAAGTGTQVAATTGDVLLVRSDPRDVPRLVRLSRVNYRKTVQNLWWATGYNIAAIVLATGILASRGVTLSPVMAAAFATASTIIVVLNAQSLRRARL
jgi:Cu2+-exporting ATPase